MKGTVAAGNARPLPTMPEGWRADGESFACRAALVRGGRSVSVTVKGLDHLRERAFVRFDSGCTGWVPIDELDLV